jgi:hypothetical protein
MSLVINGTALTNRHAAGLINTTGDLLYIATKNSSAPSGDRFNGRLDDVRIYNRALDPMELASIMTNAPPAFVSNPFSKPDANAGQLYAGSIAANADDPEKDPLTFTKLSGPAWLSVASNGALSGTPFSPQAGLNSFSVRVTDSSGAFSIATMNLTVIAAPVILASLAMEGENVSLNWTGGIAPYQVQVATNFPPLEWHNFGSTTGGTSETPRVRAEHRTTTPGVSSTPSGTALSSSLWHPSFRMEPCSYPTNPPRRLHPMARWRWPA